MEQANRSQTPNEMLIMQEAPHVEVMQCVISRQCMTSLQIQHLPASRLQPKKKMICFEMQKMRIIR